ncbi:MAG: hypothetical protein B6D58_09175 [candidate division Zixibacteria bacterium 4484_95]|nr:MAG: hypothetical protein B6D58_09175 [candidate division Zixibacteria bacterium 4484_95]RKX21176.1 MAG: hypothetical protein DRP26_00185 [candidate division Zixibacteria bacterium]
MNIILIISGFIILLAGVIVSIMPGVVIKRLNLMDYVNKERIKAIGYIFGVIGIALIIISKAGYWWK